MQETEETKVQPLGQKDPLEKGMAAHSSILTWRIPWTEEPGQVQSMGLQRIEHNWATNTEASNTGANADFSSQTGVIIDSGVFIIPKEVK